MHAGRTTHLHPATDGYPLAMLPISNRPLLSYQIEYLERNGISKIIVVIEKRYLTKVDKYFQ
jgi:NDP-sugar pyrophosphorylase family protein